MAVCGLDVPFIRSPLTEWTFVLTAVVVLSGLIVAAAVAVCRRTRNIAMVLAGLSGLWLVANKQLEGPVLFAVDNVHGLTLTDLLGFVGFLLALVLVWAGSPGERITRRGDRAFYMEVFAATALFASAPIIGILSTRGG